MRGVFIVGLTVAKSGTLYLLGNKQHAIIFDMEEKIISPVGNTQSMIARLIVSIPFKDVKNHAKLPALVRDAIDRFRRRTQSG